MSEEKIYCGNAKKVTTQFGEILKLSFTEEDLKKLQESLDNGWVNADVLERRSPSAGGMTHYLVVNTWKPKAGGGAPEGNAPAAKPAPAAKTEDVSVEDLPF